MRASIHASCVLIGAKAVLIRGHSGAGKSQLALQIIAAARHANLPFTRLVADDRVLLEAANGRLLARPVPALAGLLEVRHIGIREITFEPVAVVGLVLELTREADRLPGMDANSIQIEGISVPLLRAIPEANLFQLILEKFSQIRIDNLSRTSEPSVA